MQKFFDFFFVAQIHCVVKSNDIWDVSARAIFRNANPLIFSIIVQALVYASMFNVKQRYSSGTPTWTITLKKSAHSPTVYIN